MRNTLLASLAALGAAACSSPTWYPPAGMSDSEARVRHYECVRDGQNLVGMRTSNLLVAIDMTRDCLAAHGFREGR